MVTNAAIIVGVDGSPSATAAIGWECTNGSVRVTTEFASTAQVPTLVQMSRDAQMVVVGWRPA